MLRLITERRKSMSQDQKKPTPKKPSTHRATSTDKTKKQPLTIDHYPALVHVGSPTPSPDGSRLAYEHTAFNNPKDESWNSELWLVNADGSQPRQLPGAEPVWSPDGSKLLYLDSDSKDKTQFFIYTLSTGNSKKLSSLAREPAFPVWSPDGKWIAFRMLVPEPTLWDIDLPKPRGKQERSNTEPIIIEDLHYRWDGVGFVERGYEHLFILSADGKQLRQLTSGQWHVGTREAGGRRADFSWGFCWTPAGKSIIFDGNKESDNDKQYMEGYLYSVNVATTEITAITPIEKDKGVTGNWSKPRVSPDGRHLLFSGYTWTKLHRERTRMLWLANIDGSNLRRVGDLESAAENYQWTSGSQGFYFTLPIRGHLHLYYGSVTGTVRLVKAYDPKTYTISLESLTKDGRAFGMKESIYLPGELVSYDPENPDEAIQLTDVCAALLENVDLGDCEELDCLSKDGTPIKAWVYFPPGFEKGKKYPLIVRPNALGGYADFSYELLNYAANGYVVLIANERSNQGASGFGDAYMNAGFNGYPNQNTLEDYMTGIDLLIERGYVDPTRLFIVGSSQAGQITAWIICHTDRFAAAAVLRPVGINWTSCPGTADESIFAYNNFEKPFWENPEPWLEHSPIMHVHNVTTPTLCMTGEDDLRTPIGQTEEFYAALKFIGNVPTKLIRMPKVHHGWGEDVVTFMRLQLYVLKWFEEHDPARK
jgi:dipeptidyl aminopeptidase/acylaminoacyl peptidase